MNPKMFLVTHSIVALVVPSLVIPSIGNGKPVARGGLFANNYANFAGQ
jgi:hypothetical protein